jgi:hypothetical protein
MWNDVILIHKRRIWGKQEINYKLLTFQLASHTQYVQKRAKGGDQACCNDGDE